MVIIVSHELYQSISYNLLVFVVLPRCPLQDTERFGTVRQSAARQAVDDGR